MTVDNGRPEPDGEPGEAWDADSESGEGAWDDGSEDLWDLAEAGEDPDAEDGETHTALPPKIEAWRKRSATGAILTGFALGLQQAFEPKRDDPAIIMETSGEPPKDLPVEADIEYGRPRHSVVNIRPWLLPADQTDQPEQIDQPDQPDQTARADQTDQADAGGGDLPADGGEAGR